MSDLDSTEENVWGGSRRSAQITDPWDTVTALRQELARVKDNLNLVKSINADLMGDDEDKPRYTTKRLKLEIAKATEHLVRERDEVIETNKRYKNALEYIREETETDMWGDLWHTKAAVVAKRALGEKI